MLKVLANPKKRSKIGVFNKNIKTLNCLLILIRQVFIVKGDDLRGHRFHFRLFRTAGYRNERRRGNPSDKDGFVQSEENKRC